MAGREARIVQFSASTSAGSRGSVWPTTVPWIAKQLPGELAAPAPAELVRGVPAEADGNPERADAVSDTEGHPPALRATSGSGAQSTASAVARNQSRKQFDHPPPNLVAEQKLQFDDLAVEHVAGQRALSRRSGAQRKGEASCAR